MLNSAIAALEELRRTIRVVDVVDIVLVWILLYSALLWFRRAASRGMLLGVVVLAAVYVLARSLDMYLTSLAFQMTFTVLLFVLVVVFQEDLRRMFERLSAWPPLALGQSPSVDANVDTLVEAVFKLASSKTGALIVLKGKEPLGRHAEGGVAIDGRISKLLLYSLFDPHSPGHDGAAILDNDRIERFAVHLPLSKHKRVAGRGTRHSAALGLSERCDALTIVVSEERGVVSLTEAGKLAEIATAAELKRRVERFLAAKFPETPRATWGRALLRHGWLKLLALTIAVAAWFALAHAPNTINRTFAASIEYHNLPKHLVLDETAPDEARITLSGAERNFRFLDPGSLKITLDLTGARAGYHEIPVDSGNIDSAPANLDIYRVEPRVVRLYLRPQPSPARPAGSAAAPYDRPSPSGFQSTISSSTLRISR